MSRASKFEALATDQAVVFDELGVRTGCFFSVCPCGHVQQSVCLTVFWGGGFVGINVNSLLAASSNYKFTT